MLPGEELEEVEQDTNVTEIDAEDVLAQEEESEPEEPLVIQ